MTLFIVNCIQILQDIEIIIESLEQSLTRASVSSI